MAEYHVGCGIMGIFAGRITKTNEWICRSDVTDEALCAVAQFLLEHEQAMEFTYHDKRYLLAVNLVKSKAQEAIEKLEETLKETIKSGIFTEFMEKQYEI